MPRGLAPSGSLSATVGTPAESENRTMTGVDGRANAAPRVKVFARVFDGVNVPEHISPLA